MKNLNRTFSLLAVSAILLTQPLSAFAIGGGGERSGRMQRQKTSQPEVVRWVGLVKDEASTHTTEHEHALQFVRKDTGDSYDIKDSPDLVKLHHETEKNYLVELEAEKTSRFLFWGGNLIVKNFKVLEEASDRIPHQEPAPFERRTSIGAGDRR